jgi:hypothetical protein
VADAATAADRPAAPSCSVSTVAVAVAASLASSDASARSARLFGGGVRSDVLADWPASARTPFDGAEPSTATVSSFATSLTCADSSSPVDPAGPAESVP